MPSRHHRAGRAASSFWNKFNKLRVCMVFITLIFMAICIMYACGQLLSLELDSWFCEPKTLDEIHQHSIDNNLNGGTNDGCWTTSNNKVDSTKLFNAGSYTAYIAKEIDTTDRIVEFTAFILPFLILLVLCIYHSCSLCYDNLIFVRKDYYRIEMMRQKYTKNGFHSFYPDDPNCCFSMCCCLRWIRHIRKEYFAVDSLGWIVQTISTDFMKLAIQSVAFLQYAGTPHSVLHSFHGNDSMHEHDKRYLQRSAEQPTYVIVFAVYLSLQCVVLGVVWMCYTCKHSLCIGRFFKIMLFVVDGIFDIFYFIYPLTLLGEMELSTESMKVIVAKLHIDTVDLLLAKLVPLYFLTYRVWQMWRTLTLLARQQWIHGRSSHTRRSLEVQLSSLKSMLSYHVDINDLPGDDKDDDIFGDNEKAYLTVKMPSCSQYGCCRYCIELWKRIGISIVAVIWIAVGVIILAFTVDHFNHSMAECENYEKYVDEYPELYLWDYCTFKVYPFFSDGTVSRNGVNCNCRSFVLESSDIQNVNSFSNQTIDGRMIESMLIHWNNLETLKLSGDANLIHIRLNESTLTAQNMRVVQIESINIEYMDANIGEYWSNLQYLTLNASVNIAHNTALPASFEKLNKMKYLQISYSNINDIENFICSMQELRILILHLSPIQHVPDCVYSFEHLSYFDLSATSVQNISANQLFVDDNQIETVLLFGAYKLTPESFGNDNAISWDSSKTYVFEGNGLCYYYESRYKVAYNGSNEYWIDIKDEYYPNLWQFLNETNACEYHCEYGIDPMHKVVSGICLPEQFNNGICDKSCNNQYCSFDGGDCTQLCECDDTLLYNGICDQECNTTACNYDQYDCLSSVAGNESVISEMCSFSETQCSPDWIGDGICDQNCRREECLFDDRDCNGCTGVCATFWDVWKLLSNLIKPDYLMQQEELCLKWEALQWLLIGTPANCSLTFSFLDASPTDGVLSAAETVQGLMLLELRNASFNAESLMTYVKSTNDQVNCSQCAPSVALYYNQ